MWGIWYVVQDRRFRFRGMQFVRQKLKIFITWSIFIQIEKMTPQNRKSQRAWFNGQGPKLQKNTHFEPKNGFTKVGSRNFWKIQRLFHLTFEVMVTSLTSHSNGWWGTPYRNSSFWKIFLPPIFLTPYWVFIFDVEEFELCLQTILSAHRLRRS